MGSAVTDPTDVMRRRATHAEKSQVRKPVGERRRLKETEREEERPRRRLKPLGHVDFAHLHRARREERGFSGRQRIRLDRENERLPSAAPKAPVLMPVRRR